MWVRLKSVQYISRHGKQVTCYPGGWVEGGKQLALSWLATDQAERPDLPNLEIIVGCGVVAREADTRMIKSRLPGLDVVSGESTLAFERSLLWDPAANFRVELATAGFEMLKTWEVAVPLASYEVLARDIGDEEERASTRAVIRDLRVPFYEPRVLFVRRCRAARELLVAWREEGEAGGDGRLAFLRALYRVKPLVLALPTTWVL